MSVFWVAGIFMVFAVAVLQIRSWTALLGIIGAGAWPPRIVLLMNKAVVEELKATTPQVAIFKRRAGMLRSKIDAAYLRLESIPEAERQPKLLGLVSKVDTMTADKIAKFLKPDQAKRFKQIERQLNIPTALQQDGEVTRALKITSDQKAKLKAISTEAISQLRSHSESNEENELRDLIISVLQDANEKALAVLSDDQRSKWETLVGEPFDIDKLLA